MYRKHPFESLELRLFSRLDIADLGIDDIMASQPQQGSGSTKTASPLLTTFYLPEDGSEEKG